jgi:glutamine synthetase
VRDHRPERRLLPAPEAAPLERRLRLPGRARQGGHHPHTADGERPGADPARQFNLEFRAADAAACPHLALAVLVLAGLRGIREELPEPSLVKGDPSGLGEEDRRRLGVRPLPASLGEALEALEGDASVRSWLSRDLFDCYVGVKRTEISLLEGADPEEACERYGRIY